MLINGNLILGSTILKRTGTKATITYNLTNCISTNTAVNISKNGTYTTTLVADTSFSYVGARIIMGTKDITSTCYNISTGIVNITNVDGNITITAEKLTTFSNASWYAIKNVAQNNFASTVGWAIGDTKPLIIGDYSYTVRICDLTEGRYPYYNSTRKTNMVLETVELYKETKPRHNADNGNYAENNINQFYSDTLYNELDSDLSPLLNTLIIPIYYYSGSKSTVNAKIFMPGSTEVGIGEYEEGSVFQYYDEYGVSAKLKTLINITSNSDWWLRTGSYNNYQYSGFRGTCGVYISGTGSNSPIPSHDNGSNPSERTINAKGIPIFWAW